MYLTGYWQVSVNHLHHLMEVTPVWKTSSAITESVFKAVPEPAWQAQVRLSVTALGVSQRWRKLWHKGVLAYIHLLNYKSIVWHKGVLAYIHLLNYKSIVWHKGVLASIHLLSCKSIVWHKGVLASIHLLNYKSIVWHKGVLACIHLLNYKSIVQSFTMWSTATSEGALCSPSSMSCHFPYTRGIVGKRFL